MQPRLARVFCLSPELGEINGWQQLAGIEGEAGHKLPP
jgi:hypothetical protein